MANSQNAAGKRTFDDSYTFPQDSQDLADDIHLFANSRTGTAAERLVLAPGMIRAGLLFSETDTKRIYVALSGGGWRIVDQDTGNVTLALSSGWAKHTDSLSPTTRVRGGLTSLNGRITATGGAGPLLGVLPAGSRPTSQIVTIAHDGESKVHTLIIDPSGSMNLASKGGLAVTDLRLGAIAPFPTA